jgi:hypothetical protein
MRIYRLAPLALLLVTPAVTAAGTRLPLTVRVYDMTGDHVDRRRAFAAAARALAPAEVEVRWVVSGQMAEEAPEPQDLVLRLARRDVVADRAGTMVLGYALVDAAGRRGTVATIFMERVDWLARISGADAEELAGMAIAHEVAHLLLGTSGHARRGLMRAQWTLEELRAGRQADWQLNGVERDQLRAGLAARLGTRAGSGTRTAMLTGRAAPDSATQ